MNSTSSLTQQQCPTPSDERPTGGAFAPRWIPQNLSRALCSFLWPIVIVEIIHRAWILSSNLGSTDDFTTVWSAVDRFVSGVPVYSENYLTTDPHYLYSPGATLLLSPMALFGDIDSGRLWFAIIQAIAIVAALVMLLRWLGVEKQSPLIPGLVAIAFLTEPVTNTLDFTNVNGSLFLALVAFLILLDMRKNLLAGLIIGLAIAIKPVFLPLLFLPFMRRQFSTVIAAIAVVIAANAAAWPVMVQPRDYIDITIPYLGIVRDYANASLPGQLVWFGANPKLILLWQVFFAAFVIVALVLLLRWLERDEKFWLTTTSGLLLTGAFFLSSLGQQYYSLMLFPLVLSILPPLLGTKNEEGTVTRTVMLNWPAGLAVVLCFFLANWIVETRDFLTSWFTIAIAAFGWGLLILTIAGASIRMTIEDVRNGRSFKSGFNWLGKWVPGANSSNAQSR